MMFATAKNVLFYIFRELNSSRSFFFLFQTSVGHELSIPMPGHAITAKGS